MDHSDTLGRLSTLSAQMQQPPVRFCSIGQLLIFETMCLRAGVGYVSSHNYPTLPSLCDTEVICIKTPRARHDMSRDLLQDAIKEWREELETVFLIGFFFIRRFSACNQYHTLISAPQDEIFQTNLSYFPVFGCLTRLPWQCCTCMYRYGYACNKSRSLVGSFELLDGMVNVTDVSPKGSVHTQDSMLWSITDLPECTRPWQPYCR